MGQCNKHVCLSIYLSVGVYLYQCMCVSVRAHMKVSTTEGKEGNKLIGYRSRGISGSATEK
jgi:hypothetical protein